MTASPEPARAGLCDHTYVVLDDGSLFCVAGNQHTTSEVLGCLYYTPAAAIDEWGVAPAQGRTVRWVRAPDGSPSYKIGPAVTRDPAQFTQSLRARGIRWWPSTHLQAVGRDRIVQVLDPVAALTKLVPTRHPHHCPLEILTRLVARATAHGVSLNGIGLTGSAAFSDASICGARDIDLVLFHPVRFATFMAAAQEGWQPLAQLDTADSRHGQYLAERLPRAVIASVETHAVAARRLDVGWVGQFRVDLTEVSRLCDTRERWPFDLPSLGTAEATDSVATVGDGYPFLLTLAGRDHPIMVSRRGWQGVLRAGDRVLLRGDTFDDNGRRLLVVDNRSHHRLRLLVP